MSPGADLRRPARPPRRRARRDRSGSRARGARRRGGARRRAAPRGRRCPAREMVHAEPARAAGRGDEPGPVPVVERRVAADVAEAVELGRRLQRHDDVVVGHGIPRAAATAAEHAVARGHAVEVQRLRAVAARRRRPDRQREREALPGLHERGRGRDAFGRQVVRGADLVERRRSGPSCCAARARRRRPCRSSSTRYSGGSQPGNGTSGMSRTGGH